MLMLYYAAVLLKFTLCSELCLVLSLNKSLLTADNYKECFIRVYLCVSAKYTVFWLGNDCSIRVYHSFAAIFQSILGSVFVLS